MEFKNLAEVTKLEEVPEGASVLAATAEGEVVRVPGEGLGGSGGGGMFVVNFAMDMSNGSLTADKTFEEISDAVNSMAQPIAGVMMGQTVMQCLGFLESGIIGFYAMVSYSGTVSLATITVTSANEVYMGQDELSVVQ